MDEKPTTAYGCQKCVWDVSYVNWFVRQARSQQEPGVRKEKVIEIHSDNNFGERQVQ